MARAVAKPVEAARVEPEPACIQSERKKLPVTLLSGFLGAGKTSLLKHVLQNKGDLKCAVVVNDMAEINIDADLIKSAKVVQAEEKVVEMQNGCICCTLREDLLEEVGKLAQDGRFDYLVIESTGISEPQQVAETFAMDLNDLEAGQEEEESQEQTPKGVDDLPNTPAGEKADTGSPSGKLTSLKGLAQLDCCVTVVDASTLLTSLKSIKQVKDLKNGEAQEGDERSIAHLLIDQLEFANVILLNKTDLVCDRHRKDLEAFIQTLNPNAEIICTREAKVDLKKILNTGIFDMEEAEKSAGWLQSLLADSPHTPETEEYGVSSFIYKARKPFHPGRLHEFLTKHLLVQEPEVGAHDHDHVHGPECGTEDGVTPSDAEEEQARKDLLEYLDMEVADPEETREKLDAFYQRFGRVMRMKGHFWLPGEKNDMSGALELAGSVCRITPDQPWFAALPKELWPEGLEELEAFQKDMDGNGSDRRQELVFIGQQINQLEMSRALDACLLKDDDTDLADPFKPWPKFDIEYITDDDVDEDDANSSAIGSSEDDLFPEDSQGREKVRKT